VNSVSLEGLTQGPDYTYDTTGVTTTKQIADGADVTFSLHTNAVYGACGDVTLHDRSAVCIITTWQGSTLTNDYPSDKRDNITILRLCELAYNTCLDQRPR
jgi:hypothetical protein